MSTQATTKTEQKPGAKADSKSAGAAAASARPSVIQLAIKEKGALYAAYIASFADGGLFIPSNKDYKLGDDVYMLLTLPDDPQRYAVAGKVAWLTPANAVGGKTHGIGVRFPTDEKTRVLKVKIEQILGAHLGSERPTHTL
jgi:type IV pilus assembly protein PilZ